MILIFCIFLVIRSSHTAFMILIIGIFLIVRNSHTTPRPFFQASLEAFLQTVRATWTQTWQEACIPLGFRSSKIEGSGVLGSVGFGLLGLRV